MLPQLMKTRFKVLIGVAILAAVALAVLPRLFLKRFTLSYLKQATGFELTYQKLTSHPWARTLEVEGLVFHNPPGFPAGEAIEVRHLFARYRWRDLLGEAMKLEELRLDIPRVVMVRREDGETNLEQIERQTTAARGGTTSAGGATSEAASSGPDFSRLEAELGLDSSAPAPSAPAPAAGGASAASPAAKAEQPEVTIGTLVLKIGKVASYDYSRLKKGQPRVHEYELNVEKTFTDVTDLDAVAHELAATVLVQEGMRALTKELADPDTMEKLSEGMDKLAEQLGDLLK